VEEFSTQQIEALRQMSPSQKLNAVFMLYKNARSLKKAALRSFYPNLLEEEINKIVTDIFLKAANDHRRE